MTIFDQISEDIKKAMLARNKVDLEALRSIKKELLEAKTAKDSTGELTDEKATKVIQKLAKQIKEAALLFETQNRADLAEEYQAQVAVMNRYLPAQMSDEELTAAVKIIIEQVNATSLQDLSKVMSIASKQLAGKTEGKLISDKVKQLLG